MKSKPVVVERTYNAPAERVWHALTDVEQMRQWYFPQLVEFEPEVGFETEFDVPHNGRNFLHIWKITEVVPGKKISYEWKFGGYADSSLVSFELFADDDKTKIVVTHYNLEAFNRDNDPDLERNNFVEGWTHFIGTALKEFVEQETEV